MVDVLPPVATTTEKTDQQKYFDEQAIITQNAKNAEYQSLIPILDPVTKEFVTSTYASTGAYPDIDVITQKAYEQKSSYATGQEARYAKDYGYDPAYSVLPWQFADVKRDISTMTSPVWYGAPNAPQNEARDIAATKQVQESIRTNAPYSTIDYSNPNSIYLGLTGETAPYVGKATSSSNDLFNTILNYTNAGKGSQLQQEVQSVRPNTGAIYSQDRILADTVPFTPTGGITGNLTRPDYYNQSTLGDTKTRELVAVGYTIEQALNKQALETTDSRAATFYKNELQKSLGSNIAVASQYHSLSMKSGLPTAPNPYANVADLSLYALKGTNGKDASFSPTDFTQLGLIGGKGIQEGALNVTNAIDVISKAKVTGDTGLYNSNNLKSYSSGEGVLSLSRQQDITTRAAKSAGSEGWVTDPTLLKQLPTQKEFGYGTGGFKPSYIQDNLQATSPVPNMVSPEKFLGETVSFTPSADTRGMPITSQGGLYFTSISKMETPVAPEKNFVDKGLDIAGGFVRSVGGMTEVLGAPNIVDVVVKAKPALQYVPVLGTTLYSPIGIGTVAGREGAQEMKGGSIYSRGEPLKYGEYSAAGREFSKNVIQPVLGSPEQYEGYVKQAEIDYNRKDATFTDKSIAALSMVGNTANAWVIGKPDEVLTVGTQAAAIEVTGAFGLIGKGAELGLTKVAQIGKVAENPYVRGGINAVGKYGVDAAFIYGIAGETTRGESVQTYGMDAGGKQYLISDKEGEWFGVRTVPQLAKNVGLTGAQLVVFTGGMYSAGSIGGGAKTGGGETTSAFKEGAPYEPKYSSRSGGSKDNPYNNNIPNADRTVPIEKNFEVSVEILRNEAMGKFNTEGGISATGAKNSPEQFKAMQMDALNKLQTFENLYKTTGKSKYKMYENAYSSLNIKPENIMSSQKQTQPSMVVKPIEVKPVSQPYSRPQDLSTIKRVEPMVDVKDLTISKQKSYSKDITTKPIDTRLDIFKDKTKGISEYKSPKMDITEYKKTGTDMEIYRRPVTDITKFKPRPTDITTPRKTPTDITPYRKPIVDVTPYRRPPTDIVPKRPTPTDIVRYKDPITDVTPYKKPPTEIVKYKDPFKDIVPRPREDIIPRREEPAPKEKKLEKGGGGGAPVGLPFGGFGGGGGSSGGGGSRGGRHSTDIFKYGFGISGEIGIQVPKTKRGKK